MHIASNYILTLGRYLIYTEPVPSNAVKNAFFAVMKTTNASHAHPGKSGLT